MMSNVMACMKFEKGCELLPWSATDTTHSSDLVYVVYVASLPASPGVLSLCMSNPCKNHYVPYIMTY